MHAGYVASVHVGSEDDTEELSILLKRDERLGKAEESKSDESCDERAEDHADCNDASTENCREEDAPPTEPGTTGFPLKIGNATTNAAMSAAATASETRGRDSLWGLIGAKH